jgi:spore coat protein U-like protein
MKQQIVNTAWVRGAAAAMAFTFGSGAWAQTTLTVSATLQEGCEVVNGTAAMAFGSFTPLESTGDRVANTGSSFQVRCTSNASPALYATGVRKLTKGADEIPFNLSIDSGATSDDLPSTPGAALPLTSLTKNGTAQSVAIHGRIPVASFSNKPGGAYTSAITLQLVY